MFIPTTATASTFLFLWLYVIFIYSITTITLAQPAAEYLRHICDNTANYTRNTTFQRNLYSTLTALPTTNSGLVRLLKKNSAENYDNRRQTPAAIVEIVYITGKGYHSVYWTEGLGFSESVEDDTNEATSYSDSIDDLKQALFPTQPWYAHRRGRNLAESSGNRMRVGVPGRSLFKQFVSAEFDPEKNRTVFNGFVRNCCV
ncbi:hypothetical protein QVD17_25848 [Tagetes erecta]|uniref:Uncharacterized protein n=1 Tax=Tagetes erecta TaxID=13708 RepID=A0AAD8NPT7_TARER|nr:hypothetical protein QVD17_25848 [Tagetes erecta]